MTVPTSPLLYSMDTTTNNAITLENFNVPANDARKIEFEIAKDVKNAYLTQISGIEWFGDENTVDEPEISGETKSLYKQTVGALPEGMKIFGNITRNEDEGTAVLKKMWEFYHESMQIFSSGSDGNFPFGRIGFFSNVSPYYNVHPSTTLGLTMKAPTIKWDAPSNLFTFSIVLLLGGQDLLERKGAIA